MSARGLHPTRAARYGWSGVPAPFFFVWLPRSGVGGELGSPGHVSARPHPIADLELAGGPVRRGPADRPPRDRLGALEPGEVHEAVELEVDPVHAPAEHHGVSTLEDLNRAGRADAEVKLDDPPQWDGRRFVQYCH